MTMAPRSVVLVVLAASLLVTVAAAIEQVKYGYSGPNGPDKWGSLSNDYKLCSSGKHQSPINIVKKNLKLDKSLTSLDRNYKPTNATLINDGYKIVLRFQESAGTLMVDSEKYNLIQLHWHSPSEHTINDQRFPLELHLVHVSDDGAVAVVAILYKYGHADSTFLDDLKGKVTELTNSTCSGDDEVHVVVGEVVTKSLNRHTRKYYKYTGSFTTPPCTENVTWQILSKVRSVSKEQVAALQAPLDAAYRSNSRPLQSLNDRIVSLYDEGQK